MFKLVSDHLGDARLFTVGLGYAPNSWFMRKSAEFGRGINIQIDNIQLAREKLGALFGDMAAPTLRNITLSAGPGADIYPRRMPDLFGARPVIFVAKTPDAAAPITLTAQQADDKFTTLAVDRQSAGSAAGIGKLWARQKVEGLMDAELRGMDSEMVRQGIIDVALTHQIMSPYTSFVAVDKTPARVCEDFLKKAKLRAAPAKLASWSKVNTLATATPMAQSALFGLIALLLAGFIFFFYRKGRAFK